MGAGDPWLLVQHVAYEGPGAIALAVLRMISAANSGRLPTRSGLDQLWAGVGKLSHALGISASKIALSSITDLY